MSALKDIFKLLKKRGIKNDSILRVRCTSDDCNDTYAITVYGTRPPLKGEKTRKKLPQRRFQSESLEGLYTKLTAEL